MKKRIHHGGVDGENFLQHKKRTKQKELNFPMEGLIVNNIFGYLNVSSQCNLYATCSSIRNIVNDENFPPDHLLKMAMFLRRQSRRGKFQSEYDRRNYFLGIVYRLDGEIFNIENNLESNKYECFHSMNTKYSSFKSIIVQLPNKDPREKSLKLDIMESNFYSQCNVDPFTLFLVSIENKNLVRFYRAGNCSIYLNKMELDKIMDEIDFKDCLLSLVSNEAIAKEIGNVYKSGINVDSNWSTEGNGWCMNESSQKGIETGSEILDMLSNSNRLKIKLETLRTIRDFAHYWTMTRCSIPMTLTLPLYKKITHSSPLRIYTNSMVLESFVKIILTVKFEGSIKNGHDTFHLRYHCELEEGFDRLIDVGLDLYFDSPDEVVPLFRHFRYNEWDERIREDYLEKIEEVLETKGLNNPSKLVDIMCNYALTRKIDLKDYFHILGSQGSGLSNTPFKKSVFNGIEHSINPITQESFFDEMDQ